MAITGMMKEMLLRLRSRLPVDRQDRFAGAVRSRIAQMEYENTVKGALVGGAIGAVLEILPGLNTITGIDDWVEVGAALGAWVGHGLDQRDRERREMAANAVREALHEALA